MGQEIKKIVFLNDNSETFVLSVEPPAFCEDVFPGEKIELIVEYKGEREIFLDEIVVIKYSKNQLTVLIDFDLRDFGLFNIIIIKEDKPIFDFSF